MYAALLVIHSYWRWVVIALGLVILVRAAGGLRARRPWAKPDTRFASAFLGTLDLQFLIGLGLWWLSPYGYMARSAFAATMKDSMGRFWGLEHALTMVVAVAVAHIGNVKAKRRGEAWQRHRTMLITVLIWFALVALAFPWPGLERARPLLRM